MKLALDVRCPIGGAHRRPVAVLAGEELPAGWSAILRVAGYPHISLLHQRLCALPLVFLLHALDVRRPIGGAHRQPIRVCMAGEIKPILKGDYL